jgi:hypothetical protein
MRRRPSHKIHKVRALPTHRWDTREVVAHLPVFKLSEFRDPRHTEEVEFIADTLQPPC